MSRSALVLLMLAVSLPCAAANLLTNPGFESGPSGGVPSGWTAWNSSWSSGYEAAAEPFSAYAGTYCLRELITGSASFGVYQTINVSPSKAYKLNGMWRAETAGSSNWFEIILIDGAFSITQADSGSGMTVFNNVVAGWDSNPSFGHPAPASWDWEPFSATYGNDVSPYIDNGVRIAGGNQMTVVLKIGGGFSGPKPTVYFDDVTLTPVPRATISGPSKQFTRTGPVSYTVTFDQPVTGFDSASDIQINATGDAAVGSVSISGTGPYTVTLSDITGGGTIGIAVKADAAVNSDGNGNLASSNSALFKVFASDGSIAAVKQMANGSTVELAGKSLYLKRSGLGYIEEPDRSCGIRVEGSVSAAQGDRVLLLGTLHKVAGEEVHIYVSTMVSDGPAPLIPFGATNAGLKSPMLDGRFVTAWGEVTSVGSNSYTISDGSDADGITVNTQGAPGVTLGDYKWLTGAAGNVGGNRVIYAR